MTQSKAMQVQNKEVVKEEKVTHTLLHQIRDTLFSLDRALTNKELRTVTKVMRQVRKYRKVIKPHHVLTICESLELNHNALLLKSCLGWSNTFNEKFDEKKQLAPKVLRSLELEAFLIILTIQIYWREGHLDECNRVVSLLLDRINTANRRSLDNYSALLYYYRMRIQERLHQAPQMREQLLEAYNRACVRNDEMGQTTLLNLLLRNYLNENHIQAAQNLIEKTSFPQGKSNNQFCKYLYYTGKVKAVRREYPDALNRLTQAFRKSPDAALGFRVLCQKAAIVVQLLQGDIPNREIFSDRRLSVPLHPYYKLVLAVLQGDLQHFNSTVQCYAKVFEQDRLYTIILRLNQIVIRIGLRKISLAYSRISMADIAAKLCISVQDIEFIVAKALRDGVMHGYIDHATAVLHVATDENLNVTTQPQVDLSKRINYCLSLYHDTQKAITYPEFKGKLTPKNDEDNQVDQDLLSLLDLEDQM